MSQTARVERVERIMLDFAAITGLEPPSRNPKRYLWTDAFAVCNFLELSQQAEDDQYLDLAIRLVDQVHHTLGRHRRDDPRKGWISGLGEVEGEEHPTAGGLRIGKKLNERKDNEPIDPELEWEQDGQYYHYLTKWMHALERIGMVSGEERYLRWAVELAQKAEASFVLAPSLGRNKICWKMSIDLTHPQVSSMGQHDPLDGFVTYSELQLASKARLGEDLREEISEISEICRLGDWTTDDALGTGGLLFDAYRVGQLIANGYHYSTLLGRLLDSSLQSLGWFTASGLLRLPAPYRLAFRELGLSIGLKAVNRLEELIHGKGMFAEKTSIRERMEELKTYSQLADKIERYWCDPGNQEARTWLEHREINMVMLATSLTPGQFLTI